MKNNEKAFTLVELVVVITILAILATIGFIAFSGNTSKARKVKILSNVKNIDKLLVSKLSTGDDINDFMSGSISDNMVNTGAMINLSNTGTTTASGAIALGNLNYKVGNLNFYKLQINGEDFKIETDSGNKNYIFSYLKTSNTIFHQIAGQYKNETGKNEAIIYGKFYNRAQNSDAKGLISEKGFDIGLKNGDTLTGSLY